MVKCKHCENAAEVNCAGEMYCIPCYETAYVDRMVWMAVVAKGRLEKAVTPVDKNLWKGQYRYYRTMAYQGLVRRRGVNLPKL